MQYITIVTALSYYFVIFYNIKKNIQIQYQEWEMLAES